MGLIRFSLQCMGQVPAVIFPLSISVFCQASRYRTISLQQDDQVSDFSIRNRAEFPFYMDEIDRCSKTGHCFIWRYYLRYIDQ